MTANAGGLYPVPAPRLAFAYTRRQAMSRATILSLSLPADLRARLDAEAARRRRSRSFLVAEAVREYLSRQDRRGFDKARDRTLRGYADAAPSMLRIRIDDVEIPLADLDTLIRSKQTGRLQDRADAEAWST